MILLSFLNLKICIFSQLEKHLSDFLIQYSCVRILRFLVEIKLEFFFYCLCLSILCFLLFIHLYCILCKFMKAILRINSLLSCVLIALCSIFYYMCLIFSNSFFKWSILIIFSSLFPQFLV